MRKDQLRAIHAKKRNNSGIHSSDIHEPKLMHKSQMVGLKKNLPKLSQNQIEKLDEIWIRLDVPQRSTVLDKIGHKTGDIQPEARRPFDTLPSNIQRKLATLYRSRL